MATSNDLVDHDLQEASKLVDMPTDDDIITDWKRHDKFRFNRILFPFMTMILATFGHFLTTTYVPDISRDIYEFDGWPNAERLKVVISIVKAIFFSLAPFCGVIVFKPIHPRRKLQVVMPLVIVTYLLLAISFYTASAGLFYFSIALQSIGYGLFFHTTLMELLGWFPDFSYFVTAALLLCIMISFYLYKGINNGLNNVIGFTTVPLIHCLIYIITVMPLHFFVQSPPTYLPLFIQSMISAAALPRSSTLPLPSSLGISARIPRAMGKFHKWRRKIRHNRGRRRGYGELVDQDEIDRHEFMEMDIVEGFDVDNTDLDDLYATYQSGDQHQMLGSSTKPRSSSQDDIFIVVDTDRDKKPHQQNTPTKTTTTPPASSSKGTSTRKQEDNHDVLATISSTGHHQHHRKGDDEDEFDTQGAVFTIDDDDNDGLNPDDHNDVNNVPNTHSNPSQKHQSTSMTNKNSHRYHESRHGHANNQRKAIASTMLQQSQNHSTTASSSSSESHPRHNFRTTTGYALTAVVSQLDQFLPLPLLSIFGLHITRIYIIALPLALLFPSLVLYLLPTPLLIHLQNRTAEACVGVYNNMLVAAFLFAILLVVAAQFLGYRFIMMISLCLQLIPSVLWALLAIIGGGTDRTRVETDISTSPIHIFIAILLIGMMSFCFLLIPAMHKYFHDENFPLMSSITMLVMACCYVTAPILLIFRAPLDNASYSPGSRITVNATVYNWISRIGAAMIVGAIVCFYRLTPLAIMHRNMKTPIN